MKLLAGGYLTPNNVANLLTFSTVFYTS